MSEFPAIVMGIAVGVASGTFAAIVFLQVMALLLPPLYFQVREAAMAFWIGLTRWN